MTDVSAAQCARIATLVERGWAIREIAAEIGINRSTAGKHIRQECTHHQAPGTTCPVCGDRKVNLPQHLPCSDVPDQGVEGEG
ncbi:helix-turn-helix domain-containing protein [Halomarina oriensis]|uniref:Helix-turn-helix domain-containing protein n=1 Tax=Halomarina oriensis TaxID=671145 RepID=A0A6B0GVC8_9EURY|nr:helix-turn-helix domain-containing protein [Halomarina oriensis]MWG36543.1 hypothetical protein [Halomarina oriensis]